MRPVTLAEVVRGSVVEAIHQGHVVIADAAGRIVYSAGDPDHVCYLRSLAKPFQAAACVETGSADLFELTDEELAVIAGSHSGEDEHLAAIDQILQKINLTENALQCGPQVPLSRKTSLALIDDRTPPRPIHNNCSGKHVGMLAACMARGWDIETYLDAGHPLQQAVHALIADVSGTNTDQIIVGTDGCGVPTHALSLHGMARALAGLAQPDQAGGQHAPGLGRIRAAMLAHPFMVAGTNRLCTELMLACPDNLIAKSGAEGIYGLALVNRGLGIVVKILDGNQRALAPLTSRLLTELAELPAELPVSLSSLTAPVIKNSRGQTIGTIRCVHSFASVSLTPV